MLTLLLALAAANPALAESGVTFRADLPVRFYIDGQRVSSTANVRPVDLSVAPGEHTLLIESMLGKELHSEVIEIADGETAELSWAFRELRVRTSSAPEVAEAPEAAWEDEAEDEGDGELDAIAAAPIEQAPMEEAPIEQAPADIADVVEAAPAPPIEAVAAAPVAPAAAPEPPLALPIEAPPEAAIAPPIEPPLAADDAGRIADPEAVAAIRVPSEEEVLGEVAPMISALDLQEGEVHLSITRGTASGPQAVEIFITADGVRVVDGEQITEVPLADAGGASEAPSPEAALGALAPASVVFVSRDGRWANLYIDGELAGYLTNDASAEVLVSPGVHDVEIRDSRGRQVWHRGELVAVSGQALEIGFARDLEPQAMGQEGAWRTLEGEPAPM
jgi:hypothetical protein